MKIAIMIVSCFLWLWFLGCTFSWKFGTVLLVEGMGLKSIEFAVLLLFTVAIGCFMLFESIGKWILLSVLALWIIVQFFCHEYFTIFGASPKKLNGYNKCFAGTLKLFPKSETRLVPDFYHIMLHLLIIADLVLVLIKLIKE